MRIIRIILRSFVDCIRYVLSKPDERGNFTSDLFRFRIRKKVRQLINKNTGFLLDIGCGEGLLYEKLSTEQKMLKIIGIDTNHETLSYANKMFQERGTNKVSFMSALAQDLPFRDNSIDIVVCINTFYNFYTKKEVVDALKEMARVCKRDGFLIFDVRNKLNPFVYYGFKWVWLYDSHVTLNAYSLRELTEVLSSSGIVVKDTVPLGFPITTFAPAILVKAEHKKA